MTTPPTLADPTGPGTLIKHSAQRLADLEAMTEGWWGPGLSLAPTRAALTSARDFLGALPATEQAEWSLIPSVDGGIEAERSDDLRVNDSMICSSIDPKGSLTFIGYDAVGRATERPRLGPDDCARAVLVAVENLTRWRP